MATTTNLLEMLSPAHRDRLPACATDVSFPAGARIFEEGGREPAAIHPDATAGPLRADRRRAAALTGTPVVNVLPQEVP